MLKGYICERCGHKWAPRENVVARPKVCPKCKSAYWNTPKRLNVTKT
jgi:predicted Zn-ribbon and HTH transcriptional regulator